MDVVCRTAVRTGTKTPPAVTTFSALDSGSSPASPVTYTAAASLDGSRNPEPVTLHGGVLVKFTLCHNVSTFKEKQCFVYLAVLYRKRTSSFNNVLSTIFPYQKPTTYLIFINVDYIRQAYYQWATYINYVMYLSSFFLKVFEGGVPPCLI